MHIDKDVLIDALRARGSTRHLSTVEHDLPDRIDTEEYADLLRRVGIPSSEIGTLAERGRETGGFGGFGGPGARIRSLDAESR